MRRTPTGRAGTSGVAAATTLRTRSPPWAACDEADHHAASECLRAWTTTDFRDDLSAVRLPTLVVHGDHDQTVPFDGSGRRTHEAIAGSTLAVIAGGPHGVTTSHADAFNRALLDFLAT